VPIGLTWAVARAVTETLNPVVSQCVVNQTHRYWLLSDVVAGALQLIIQMEAQQLQRSTTEPSLECGEFEYELEILYRRMASEVATVLQPFLSFARTFDAGKAHNMLALMLDPRFKDLEVILNYVGHDVVKQVVDEYDSKVLVPLLLKATTILSHVAAVEPAATADLLPARTKLFGAPASTAEANKGLLLTEISLFRRLVVDPADIACPLMWWKE
jgi:hypothetical protein